MVLNYKYYYFIIIYKILYIIISDSFLGVKKEGEIPSCPK